MTTRTKLFIGLALGAVCLLMLLHRHFQAEKNTSPKAEVGQAGQQPANRSSEIGTPQEPTDLQIPPVSPDPGKTVTVRTSTSGEIEGHKKKLMEMWQRPIDFHGKVVDESTNPIEGASIQLTWDDLTAENFSRVAAGQTDAAGLFSLQGKQGRSLNVQVSKEGYFGTQSAHQTFMYSMDGNFSADPRNPVLFILRKRRPGAELITSDNGMRSRLALRVPKDGTPIRVDFFQKQMSSAGHLEISRHKPPSKEANGWSFRVSIPDGGLIENQDEFQFEAPEENYRTALEYRFTKSETNWITHVTKQFYVAFGQPRKYGWLRIESDLAQETIFLTYAINPTGLRNLEPMEANSSRRESPQEHFQ